MSFVPFLLERFTHIVGAGSGQSLPQSLASSMTTCCTQWMGEGPGPKLEEESTGSHAQRGKHFHRERGNPWGNLCFQPARSSSGPEQPPHLLCTCVSTGLHHGRSRQAPDFKDTSLPGDVIAPVTKMGGLHPEVLLCPGCPPSSRWHSPSLHPVGSAEGALAQTPWLALAAWSPVLPQAAGPPRRQGLAIFTLCRDLRLQIT